MARDWFGEARFGMFVHWDHASQQGLEVSWPLVGGLFALPRAVTVPVEQYHASAATFDPVEWDPAALAALARRAGMRYAVFTTKHHSGYTMWPSAFGGFGCRQDLVGSFVDAFRSEGLHVGLYVSLPDWHHPDYPAFRQEDQPYVPGQHRRSSPEAWDRFLADLRGQLTELLTNYGDIGVLWWDGGWERTPEEWQAARLEELVRDLQPGILLNDRLPGARADFTTPEQFVPPRPPDGPWETCLTMNDSWGWVPEDEAYKSGRELVHTLCEVAGRGGNLLLNVSPTGTGALPAAQRERLEHVARWMAAHGESIAGTQPGLEPWQHYGPSTRRGGRVYAHLLSRPYDAATIRGIPVKRVTGVRALGTGAPLSHRTRTGVIEGLFPDPDGELRIDIPPGAVDDDATVVVVDLADQPLARPTTETNDTISPG